MPNRICCPWCLEPECENAKLCYSARKFADEAQLCSECRHLKPLHSRTCSLRPDARLVPRYPATDTSAERKATPMWSGVLRYFPDAIAAVARLSKRGNDKHNPGEPLHWSRGKSNDHGDCIVRHQMEPEALDPDTGEIHAVAVAWRALAQLQLLEEKRLGKSP